MHKAHKLLYAPEHFHMFDANVRQKKKIAAATKKKQTEHKQLVCSTNAMAVNVFVVSFKERAFFGHRKCAIANKS